MKRPATLIIPVESQVRELDAKLLLSCCAAERGYPVLIGSRAFVHFRIGSMPRGIYVAKSMRGLSSLMFSLIRKMGHEIVAWEEEALVHPPPDVFYSLRLSPETMRHVSRLFAWGRDNEKLMKQYPALPRTLQIHVTGNPRGDLLRNELRPYFADEVARLRAEHGEFLLINTNFTDINPFLPSLGLFVSSGDPSKQPRMGQAGKGMPREFATGLAKHKRAILQDFLAMIPALEEALPDTRIVIRPHPSEDHGIYHQLAARCSRVVVTHRGNVLPWLLASRALVHNGCTTAIEAYAMEVPAVAYLATFDERYDHDFQGLPNQLSRQCFDLDTLIGTVRDILRGFAPSCRDRTRESLLDACLDARQGALASERVLDVLDADRRTGEAQAAPPLGSYLQARTLNCFKALLTRLNMQRPGLNRAAYHDHRFPGISVQEVSARVRRLGEVLQRFDGIRVRQHSEHIFEIRS